MSPSEPTSLRFATTNAHPDSNVHRNSTRPALRAVDTPCRFQPPLRTQRATNLSANFSVIATNLPGIAGATTFTDTNAPASGAAFYRVGVTQ